MEFILVAAIAAGTGLIAWLGTGALIPLLRRRAVLDRPNERSLHLIPTPRGGGIVVVAAILLACLGLSQLVLTPTISRPILVGGALLAAVSWIDDVRSLPAAVRLAVQLVAIGLALRAGLPAGPVFQGWLPPALDGIATAVLWLWFINLFNFMDGIDGLAGSEAAAIGIGLLLLVGIGGGPGAGMGVLAGAIGTAAIGFVLWNWGPASLFLGDIGREPIGN